MLFFGVLIPLYLFGSLADGVVELESTSFDKALPCHRPQSRPCSDTNRVPPRLIAAQRMRDVIELAA
jgi:hypothetical protein